MDTGRRLAILGLAPIVLLAVSVPVQAAATIIPGVETSYIIYATSLSFLVGALVAFLVLFKWPRKSASVGDAEPAAERHNSAEHLDGSVMETVLAPIILIDAEWTVLEANRSAERAFHKVRDKVLGANLKELFGIEHDPSETGLVSISHEGRERFFAFHSNSWKSASDEERSTIVLNDVTDIKQAVAEARRSEQRFRNLAENAADMIVTISPDRIRTYVSAACEKMLGYTPEELIGQSPLTGTHPDDRAHIFEVSESLMKGGDGQIARYRHMHKDGHYVWLEASFQVVRDSASGDVVEFVGTVRDISERAPEELAVTENTARMKEANRLLEMAESLAGVGHWRVDLVTGAVLWSEQIYHLHGVGRDYEPFLRGAINFYHEDDRQFVSEAIEKAIETGAGFNLRAKIVQQNGAIRHVHLIGQTEVAPTGETIGIFGVIRDISAEVASEEQLRASRDEAEDAMRAKSAFLANMSHEIRTPMNGVIGFAGLMLDDELSTAQRERARLILESGEAMLQLLNDILDLSKIDAAQMSIARVPTNLTEIVTSCQRMFDASAANKGLHLQVELDPGTPKVVLGDALRLRQILSNLVGNAIKFTDRGGVTVKTRRQGENVIISVEDSGIGIAAGRQEAIFEDFVQADIGITGERGGTGLGLAIAKQLVVLMGGTITLESELGAGSTFTVSLPFEDVSSPGLQDVQSPALQPAQAVTLRDGRQERVLLAEDNEVNCYLVAEMAERMGLRLYIAGNGIRAVQMVMDAISDADPFQLVLMDLQMPEMDGLSATRAIRDGGIGKDELPIVALTANAYAEDIAACLDVGMQAHLAKPITYQQLREAVFRWLPNDEAPKVVAQTAAQTEVPGQTDVTAQTDVHLPAGIRERYDGSLVKLADALTAFGKDNAPTRTEINDLAAMFHSIAGTAGYFGEATKGDVASSLERALLNASDADSVLAIAELAKAHFARDEGASPESESKAAQIR